LALVSAKKHGLDVAVILDKSNNHLRKRSRYSGATFVAHAGIPVFIDYQPAIAHTKIIIIDRHLVISGSYNFTHRAERNAENVTFIDSFEVANRFLSNWSARRAVSSGACRLRRMTISFLGRSRHPNMRLVFRPGRDSSRDRPTSLPPA